MFNSSLSTQSTARSALTNDSIATGLEEIARLLPQEARNHERRRVLRRAAESIRNCQTPVTALIEDRGIEGVHMLDICYEVSGVVTDWVRSGRLSWLERLKVQASQELAQLPSIGPRLAQVLREVLGVIDIDGLIEAAREGQLATLCGFGPKRLKMVNALLAARGVEVRAGATIN